MGLDTSHNCWSGSCSTFNNFRRWLASKININLDDYEGYKGKIPFSTLKHNIKPLLNHSDCEGHLTVPQCKRIVKGLDEILGTLPEPKISREHYTMAPTEEYYYWKAVQFKEGCLDAIAKNERVEFH